MKKTTVKKHDEAHCRWCREFNEFKLTVKSKDPKVLQKYIRKLFDCWQMTDADLNYYQVVFDGSWPQSVEILERALEKAKALRAAQPKEL